jgi:N-acetylmuramate 1-kinase
MSVSESSVSLPEGIDAFLSGAGWDGAEIEPLTGDASFRRYFRVRSGERTAMLMDAPPPQEDPTHFLRAATWLDANGMRAPRILADDAARRKGVGSSCGGGASMSIAVRSPDRTRK